MHADLRVSFPLLFAQYPTVIQSCGFFHQNIVRVGSRPVWEVCLSEPRFPNMKSGSSKSLQGLETAGKRLR